MQVCVKGNQMKVGYVRVSTEEQNTARQDQMMADLGVEKIFVDKMSGKDVNRPQLKAMLDYVREGDTLIVESYSRLSRSLQDLLNIVSELERKNVQFVSLKENIDTTTPQGRFFMRITASMSEYERELIVQRTREGVAIAKAQGKYKGRKPKSKPENWDYVMTDLKDGKIKVKDAIKRLGVPQTTFYRMLKRYEQENRE